MASTSRPVRIVDVAALAGVSPGTVSKALNNTGALRASTRERVCEAAERLGFVPDGSARTLASRRSYSVGLLSSDSAGRFSIPVMLGAENALAAGQVSALLATSRGDPVREQHHVRALLGRRVDGIIVTGRNTEPRRPIDVPVPVVYAYAPSQADGDASVVPDDAAGARMAVAHLLALGRTRVALVTGRADRHSAQVRVNAAREALRGAGLDVAGEPLFGEWTERWGRQATDVLLRTSASPEGPGFDAIMCGSDQVARGVTDRLRERGCDVPGQVAVTGYDDWDVMSLASRPPLTTVDPRLEHLGRRAAELLLDAIEGQPHHGLELVPPRLVVRASTTDD
ncbi:substrate-binding domain-containing protein [Actinopolymorpha rutila]|uniref:LacI family transcriptional regulator n=1 Tax=Actinopolymorpha rutila TaxID=446787 RepID=A0A852ZJF8_9ACTN|nr:LacI family transcriptional regulator [Actinopolymorpha rutila]